MVSAQDKLMAVASRLGLDTLQFMQGSTGAIYDADLNSSGLIFSQSSQHANPNITNINDNRFEVNEALLVETIGFYRVVSEEGSFFYSPFQNTPNLTVLFDLVIGNKTVMKDVPVFAAGQNTPFGSVAIGQSYGGTQDDDIFLIPRMQVFLEGAGIVIPPQVEFYIKYTVYNTYTGTVVTNQNVGCYLFGTKVNLNFNTTL